MVERKIRRNMADAIQGQDEGLIIIIIKKSRRKKIKCVGGKRLTDEGVHVIEIIDTQNILLPIIGGLVITVAIARDTKGVASEERTLTNVTYVGIVGGEISISDTSDK